jgi:hypothetical protein
MSSVIAIVASIVIIITGAAAFTGWLVKRYRIRKAARTQEVAEQGAERQRLAQRRKTRILSPVGIRIPQNAETDPWAGTSASGYGSVKRDWLRRNGLTPAGYARGETRRKTK